MIIWTPTRCAVRVLALATLTLTACVTPRVVPDSVVSPVSPAQAASPTESAIADDSNTGEAIADSAVDTRDESTGDVGAGQGGAASQDTEPMEPSPAKAPVQWNPFDLDRLLIYRIDFGQRLFASSDWDPVSDPFLVSLGLIYEPKYWALGMEAGFSYSTDDGIIGQSGYESQNLELFGGLTKSFWLLPDNLLLTLAGGMSLNWTKERINVFTPPATNGRVDGRNSWLAGYVRTRLAWKFTDVFDVGIDVRASSGQNVSTIGPVKSSENYQVLLGIGIHQ